MAHEIALVKLDGTTLNGLQVCDLYSFCFNADGQTPGKAYAPTDTLRLKGTSLKWGLYTLLLQGVMTNLEMCYSVQDGGKNEATIFVGAGDVNPIINHDMKKASTNPACN